jgi:5'-nucleotidase (lipoprotein e(P4) family)
MLNSSRLAPPAFALLVLTACTAVPTAPAPQPTPAPAPAVIAHENIDATLWMQTAAEYRAVTREIYGWATRLLEQAKTDPSWTAATEQSGDFSKKPPAIILDLDETVLDTSAYQVGLIQSGAPHTEERWDAYAQRAVALAIPPALDFVRYASQHGVEVFYITNRVAAEKAATRRNLEELGFPFDPARDTLITRGERPEWDSSDKTARRRFVADSYRVLFLFGDDLNDFIPAAGKSIEERAALVAKYDSNWGTKWFALPNPTYGSWERAVVGNRRGLTHEEELKAKREMLRP